MRAIPIRRSVVHTCQRDPAVHRVVPGAQADAEQPDRAPGPAGRSRGRTRRSRPARASSAGHRSGWRAARPAEQGQRRAARRRPGAGRAAARSAPYAATTAGPRATRRAAGRASGARPWPTGAAGEPAQRWLAGTAPVTVEPAAISAPLPIRAPGISVLRAPTRAPAPMRTLPIRHDVAVDPVAGQVDLGLDRRAAAELEQAGDRRRGVQVDVGADLRAERPGVGDHPGGAGHAGRAGQLGEPLGRPQPQVHAAAARVAARAHAAQQQPGPAGGQRRSGRAG